MLLRRGRWKGERVVPGEWIDASTRQLVDTGEPAGAYGYHCWAPKVGGFATRGYKGHSVYAFPDRDLLVLFNAALPPAQAETVLDGLVKEYVFPAVR
jgi:hypothetical protein